ncbi:MAG: flagellar biosynthesis anti-sigma factor FlgM [Caldilineaceae bacterium]|nr:flagellar biosynthesis anti-sigma factor FlgM [Caldilineaceae bacterium]
MKVTGAGNQNLQQIYQSQVERSGHGQESSQAAASRPSDRKDSVELSSQARLLQIASEETKRDEPARQERVDQLREQVQADTYQVPVQQLATRMMSELF